MATWIYISRAFGGRGMRHKADHAYEVYHCARKNGINHKIDAAQHAQKSRQSKCVKNAFLQRTHGLGR